MEWVQQNWFWVVVFVAFIAMHVFGHGGHGGHGGGGCGGGHGHGRDRSSDQPDAPEQGKAETGGGSTSGHRH